MAGLRAIVRLITRHHSSPQPGRNSINKQNQFKRDLSELSLFWAGARGRLLSAAEVQAVCCQFEILNRRKVVLWLCKKNVVYFVAVQWMSQEFCFELADFRIRVV